jgi:predicted transposase YbfD/YdcC
MAAAHDAKNPRHRIGAREKCGSARSFAPIAIDGKVLRRSFDRASGKSPLHMVSAWGCEQRLVLAQIATDAKSSEITAVPKLLEMLTLKGTIVTVDALNCQREIAQKIIGQGGDYVLALKGNQGTLRDDVVRFLDDPESEVSTLATTVDGDHGRIETRTAMVATKIDWLQEDHYWPGLVAIGIAAPSSARDTVPRPAMPRAREGLRRLGCVWLGLRLQCRSSVVRCQCRCQC